MASLSQVTDLTRKLLEYVGIGVVAIILLVIIFNVGRGIKEMLSPTPPPAPTVAFGKLSLLSFPPSTSTPNISYALNTLTGSLPDLGDRMTVYKLEQPAPNLLNLDRAKQIAEQAGFRDNPITLSETAYKWTTSDNNLSEILTMDIQSFDFLFTTSYTTNQTVLDAPHVPSEDDAVKAATDYFARISPLPKNIDTSKTKTTLWAITNGKLTPATSLSSAQVVRVDFFPENVEKLPIYTPNPDDSYIYALVASSETPNPQVVEAQMYHKAITTDKATYPIKTAQQAYDELQKGKGFIASIPDNTTQINITNVTLGYYLDMNSQNYLMPIIVFQGDKGFFAYISAVRDDYIEK